MYPVDRILTVQDIQKWRGEIPSEPHAVAERILLGLQNYDGVRPSNFSFHHFNVRNDGGFVKEVTDILAEHGWIATYTYDEFDQDALEVTGDEVREDELFATRLKKVLPELNRRLTELKKGGTMEVPWGEISVKPFDDRVKSYLVETLNQVGFYAKADSFNEWRPGGYVATSGLIVSRD